MASKAELLASARKKGQRQQIFRRGRGTTTSVRQPAVDRNAGREAKAVSDFLGTMLKFGPGVLDAHNRETNEENKKLVAKGEATYKNATPDQRKQFRDNVRNGTISGGESPYFREGLRRSHADAMALEYGNSVMLAWESSEAKNSADPEAFTNFLDEFQHKAEGPPGMNRSWKERVGDLGDHVANEEFWPKADAVKRQLSQIHSQHQRTEYNKKAQDNKQTSEAMKLNDTRLELSMDDSLTEVLLSEYVQDDALTTHINILNKTKNRRTRDGNSKSKFISNALSKGMNMKEARVAWNTKKNSLGVTVNNLSLETIGQASENVFSIAAFKKEAKETKNDESAYQVAMQKIRKKGKGKDSFSELAASGMDKSYKGEGGKVPPTFKAVADVGFTPTQILTPIEREEEDNLDLRSVVLTEDFDKIEESDIASLVHPSDTEGTSLHGQPESAQWILSQGPEMDEKLKKALRATPSKSINVPQPKVESDEQVDVSIMTALHKELGEKKEVEGKNLTRAKGGEWIETGGTAEDQVAAVETEASVPQPMQPSVETAMSDAAKSFEGVSPNRTHYGVVAYKTQDEADLMVEKIREGIIGDTTGIWELATVKVGNLYQVQTQGNIDVTNEQKAAFFNKLASEYPGQMGNLKAGVKDKDYVQIIPPKKYKKEGK